MDEELRIRYRNKYLIAMMHYLRQTRPMACYITGCNTWAKNFRHIYNEIRNT